MPRLVRINSHLTVGGEPTLGQLRRLADDGFRGVLDLRLEKEPGDAPPSLEAGIVQRQGVEYRHLPVPPAEIGGPVADRFRETLRHLPTPALVHSRTGHRAAALLLMHLGVTNGWTGEYTVQQARHIGLPVETPHDAEAVRHYVDDHRTAAPAV